jgi:hypothetical protein
VKYSHSGKRANSLISLSTLIAEAENILQLGALLSLVLHEHSRVKASIIPEPWVAISLGN